MPFFRLEDMPGSVISPGHSTANGPTITGKELELGYYTEPKGSGAKPHHHPSEQMIMVVNGRLRMRIDDEVREMGPGEVALILGDQDHEQQALEDGTRFLSFKTALGAQPVDE
ncbi:MAG: cupin domain-containing protein [Chloroflexi bacterium]|nr:cupin domain-containing protein [Chloroflexota bacterium]